MTGLFLGLLSSWVAYVAWSNGQDTHFLVTKLYLCDQGDGRFNPTAEHFNLLMSMKPPKR